jgi:hypothetical protein
VGQALRYNLFSIAEKAKKKGFPLQALTQRELTMAID